MTLCDRAVPSKGLIAQQWDGGNGVNSGNDGWVERKTKARYRGEVHVIERTNQGENPVSVLRSVRIEQIHVVRFVHGGTCFWHADVAGLVFYM